MGDRVSSVSAATPLAGAHPKPLIRGSSGGSATSGRGSPVVADLDDSDRSDADEPGEISASPSPKASMVPDQGPVISPRCFLEQVQLFRQRMVRSESREPFP